MYEGIKGRQPKLLLRQAPDQAMSGNTDRTGQLIQISQLGFTVKSVSKIANAF